MHSRSRVPEEPAGGARTRPLLTGGRADAELAAIAILCLVFAWPAEGREHPQPRSDS
ncbi:MAG TPA: hypothetical protein VMA77_13080 [Solirubrobacteraceae bacterium]|nr:hypothetical protein [Solirubrobacteraceae bacterium]